MSRIRLQVPLVAQEKNNCCWHTAAFMIWLYWRDHTGRSGPMNTLRSNYDAADTDGLGPHMFATLAKTVGLQELPVKNQHVEADLYGYLQNHGPVWSAGYWFGPGHVIVLTGIDSNKVYFNDPDQGVAKEATVKWFNEKLASQIPGCLMVRDSGSY